ncbi:hypothetical protein [Bartonella sp. HY038]|uniref:hypothetical protein n=1 Tax=Bartonella sp. HY038 TaxID=2759660 RepID=UPI0015F7DF17|nr:hypothetical protein [Bartonella sp. HY038]
MLEPKGLIGAGLTLKGLRHTVATILAELGYDGCTIAGMLGQRTTGMDQHYLRSAKRFKKLTPVIVNLVQEVNRRKTKNV